MSKENHRAYEEGSEHPAENPNLLRLYGMRFCPYAERIRLALKYLKVKHDVININTNSKPEWFLDFNPDGNVPVIKYKGVLLSQSLLCLDFINEEFGKNKLLAKKPLDKAFQRVLMDKFDKVATPIGNIVKTTERAAHKENLSKIHKEFENYEKLLSGPFFGNKTPCLIDFAFWPWFERFPALSELTSMVFLPDSTFPKLTEWVNQMKKLDIVKQIVLPDDLHNRYFVLKQAGSKDLELVNLGLDD